MIITKEMLESWYQHKSNKERVVERMQYEEESGSDDGDEIETAIAPPEEYDRDFYPSQEDIDKN